MDSVTSFKYNQQGLTDGNNVLIREMVGAFVDVFGHDDDESQVSLKLNMLKLLTHFLV